MSTKRKHKAPRQPSLAPTITIGRTDWKKVTGLPTKTCDELVRCGIIRSFKIGRRRMFLLSDVEKLMVDLVQRGIHLKPGAHFDALATQRAQMAQILSGNSNGTGGQ